MRKEVLWIRLILVLAVLWLSLTTYKTIRRMGGKEKASLDAYYSKPVTPEERRQELGRSTWTFLHNVAAKYPAYPTRDEQSGALKLIDLLTKLFPCAECRGHFTKLVEGFPPKVGSQEEFSRWMCEAHNIVNKRLGKRIFDCARLDDRWDCGCTGK